jgi:hypothetical protein
MKALKVSKFRRRWTTVAIKIALSAILSCVFLQKTNSCIKIEKSNI